MDGETPAPNLNGHHPAPLPPSSGALYSARPVVTQSTAPTAFPGEIDGWSLRQTSYLLGWAQWGDLPLMRWLWVVGVVVSIVLAVTPVPNKLWLIALIFVTLAAVAVARPILARGHFVKFVPEEGQGREGMVAVAPLSPAQKVPIYVTGILDVNERQQRFVALPGFYRTFATREHALLGQCRDRRILGLGVPPERDLGLWFAFFDAAKVHQIERGTISPGGTPLPTLRLAYEAHHVKRRGASTPVDTLYISCATDEDLARVEADLRFDWPVSTAESAPRQTQQSTPTKA